MDQWIWLDRGRQGRTPRAPAWAVAILLILAPALPLGRRVLAQDRSDGPEQTRPPPDGSAPGTARTASDGRPDGGTTPDVGDASAGSALDVSLAPATLIDANEVKASPAASAPVEAGAAIDTNRAEPPELGESPAPTKPEPVAQAPRAPPGSPVARPGEAPARPAEQPTSDIARENEKASQRKGNSHYGLGADIGLSGPLPDGGLLVILRPFTWFRVQAGGGYNGLAPGVRGGTTLVNPFILPLSFTCEGGHYFEGDANKVVHWFSNNARDIASLRRLSYDYLNLLGGLDFGNRSVSFYVRGGVTWMRTTVKDFAQSVRDIAQVDMRSSDLKVTYRGPTLKLGMGYFFF